MQSEHSRSRNYTSIYFQRCTQDIFQGGKVSLNVGLFLYNTSFARYFDYRDTFNAESSAALVQPDCVFDSFGKYRNFILYENPKFYIYILIHKYKTKRRNV